MNSGEIHPTWLVIQASDTWSSSVAVPSLEALLSSYNNIINYLAVVGSTGLSIGCHCSNNNILAITATIKRTKTLSYSRLIHCVLQLVYSLLAICYT